MACSALASPQLVRQNPSTKNNKVTYMSSSEHDYLIVGGGSAGSVLAGRLSEQPHTSVVLLEAGGTGDSQLVKTPMGVVAMLPTRINN